MSGLEGICPKCSSHFYGWALSNQRNQLCVRCGSALEIRKDDVVIRIGCSPFKANEYRADSNQGNWEDLRNKNLLFYLTMN
jgi:hypothetical protein